MHYRNPAAAAAATTAVSQPGLGQEQQFSHLRSADVLPHSGFPSVGSVSRVRCFDFSRRRLLAG